MCGITGFIAKSYATKRDIDNVMDLLIHNESRGEHSTGIATIGKRTNIKKDKMRATEFVKKYKVQNRDIKILIGHTRHATVGDVSKRNAHPFKYGNIIGAHNGSVYNYLEIDKTLEVDSQAIFKELNKQSNDYKKALKKLSGDFAISWTEGEKLYLVRDYNPLYILETETGVYYSSQELPLAVIGRKENREPEQIETETVYTLDGTSIEKEEITFKHQTKWNKAEAIISEGNYYSPQYFGEEEGEFIEIINTERIKCDYCDKIPKTRLESYYSSEILCEDCYNEFYNDEAEFKFEGY